MVPEWRALVYIRHRPATGSLEFLGHFARDNSRPRECSYLHPGRYQELVLCQLMSVERPCGGVALATMEGTWPGTSVWKM